MKITVKKGEVTECKTQIHQLRKQNTSMRLKRKKTAIKLAAYLHNCKEYD